MHGYSQLEAAIFEELEPVIVGPTHAFGGDLAFEELPNLRGVDLA